MKIEFKELKKSFNGNTILNGISGSFDAEKSNIILGTSGTGKSVLIKTICGLIKQDYGDVLIDGYNLSKIGKKDRNKLMSNIGFLFQGGALFDSLSVFENVAFRLIHYDKMPRKKARDIATEKLNLVGLDSSILDNDISSLSGGMQKRVSLARTISYNPKIIFFDEPTTGLDPIMTSVVSDLIMKCQQNLKSTNIVVTHEMKLAREIGDKIIFLSKGDIIWNGSKNTIENPNNQTVYNFVNGVVSDQAV